MNFFYDEVTNLMLTNIGWLGYYWSTACKQIWLILVDQDAHMLFIILCYSVEIALASDEVSKIRQDTRWTAY